MTPIQTAQPQIASQVAISSPHQDADFRVLLVDDEREMREALALGLRVLGMPVVSAANGAEALEVLREDSRIAVLLTDLRMPGMDGLELARRAQDARPPTQPLELLVMSGNINFETEMQHVVGEATEFLAKPFTLQAVGNAVRRALQRVRGRQGVHAG